MHRLPFTILVILILVFGSGVVAQDTATQDDPVIIGDENAESLQIVRSYLESRDPNLLAEDVAYFESSTAGPVTGRDLVTQTGGLLYNEAFTDTIATPVRYIVADEGYVIAEMEFTGTNTGTFAEQPATDMEVLIPMIGVYQVDTGQIVRASVYYDTNQLYRQLGYTFGTGVGVPTPDPAVMADVQDVRLPTWVGNVLEEPAAYYGQQITVDGYVGRAISSDSFVLYENQFLAPNYEVLVITQSEEAQDFIQLADTRVRVEGTVYQLGSDAMTEHLGGEIDPGDFEGTTVIVADSITNAEVVQTIGHIVDNPEAFYGQEVTVNGLIGDPVSTQAFTLYQDQLIGIRGEVLVINNTGQEIDFEPMRDTRIRIRGTVYNPDADGQAITDQTGIPYDDPAFNDYRDMPVIVAEEMAPTENQ